MAQGLDALPLLLADSVGVYGAVMVQFMWLLLADSVGVYGAVHVDCGAVLHSQNGLPDSISNAADIRMLTMSMPECQA